LHSSIGYPDIDTLVLVIANSQIVVTQAIREVAEADTLRPLPAGFDEIDVAILEWIASEGRRLGRGVPRL
jgi:hypothetical protein